MRVRVHPADRWGCGHYRLIWPTRALREQGYDVEIVEAGEESGMSGVIVGGRLMDVDIREDADADVFVFQRVTNQTLCELIKVLRGRGKTVVVDMDDDLTCIHPKNAAFTMLHPKLSPKNNWQHARAACQLATLVTVSTPELQRRYGVDHSRVLRNCVPKEFLDVQRPDVEPVWGWAGALHSHPDDLPIIGGAVNELRRRGRKFKIVGYTEGTGRALGLAEDPDGTGRIEFDDWAQALAQLRVGVAPLADTRFNAGKSWLKPLEYAALGVPWVGSNRGEYGVLRDLGAGFTVDDRTRSWVRVVQQLMGDDSYWQETSEACRAVAAQITIEEHAWRWMETWEVAYQLDHDMKSVAIM